MVNLHSLQKVTGFFPASNFNYWLILQSYTLH